MSDLQIAAQQGLDALYRWHMTDGETDDLMPAFEALRAALAQPAASGEPVAWYLPADGGDDSMFRDAHTVAACTGNKWPGWQPLYAAPQPAPARVPLTDEQIDMITAEQWGAGLGSPYAAYRAYARAVEAAHGIAPDAQEERQP